MEKLLTINQLCEAFQISRPTERRMRKDGLLRPSVNDGKTIRYTLADLKSTINNT